MQRAEIRRLVDWFLTKMDSEVTRHLVRERVFKPMMPEGQGGGSPDSAAIRAARANIRQHLKYINWMAGTRNWLAGCANHLCRSRRRRRRFRARLSRRGGLEGAQRGARLVCAGEVAPAFRPPAHRPGARPVAGVALCGPRFLRFASRAQPRLPRCASFIEREARLAGFDQVAVTSPDAMPLAAERLSEFVAPGLHGSMDWMRARRWRGAAIRAMLWPEVRSIIVLAMNYGPAHDPLAVLNSKDRGAISVYAQNRDYHDMIKGKLKGIAGKLVARAGGDVKVFVDTAPVMEKPLAEAAGIGWQGKHTNLVSRELGSWLFLGTIFTTADLAPDAAETDHCGSCRACLDACPTDAFPAPYRLDARRCISYLTIENKAADPA